MVPDTSLRLSAVVKALQDIITPALPAEARFAHEQLELIKKSIQIAIDQIPHEHAFAVRDAQDYMALAKRLIDYVEPETQPRERLASLIARGDSIVPTCIPDRPEFEVFLRQLKREIEAVVEMLCGQPAGSAQRDVQMLVLDHCARQTLRERAWTIATGFESDPNAVPPVAALIYGEVTSGMVESGVVGSV